MPKVLFVDNNPQQRMLYQEIALDHGWDGVVVAEASEFIDSVRATAPDVIVTEWNLEPVGTRRIAEALREDPELGRIPIIVVTAQMEYAVVPGLGLVRPELVLYKPAHVADMVAGVELLAACDRSIQMALPSTVIGSLDSFAPPHFPRAAPHIINASLRACAA